MNSCRKLTIPWLVFISVSLLVHLLIISLIENIKELEQTTKPVIKQIVVNIAASPEKTNIQAPHSLIKTQGHVTRPRKKLQPVKKTLKADDVKTIKTRIQKKATQISKKKLQLDLTKIVRQVTRKQSNAALSSIFNPQLRKKIEQSKQYYTNSVKAKSYELISRSIDASIIRMGDNCLHIPNETDYDPKKLRIISFDLNCPKKIQYNLESKK